MSNNGSGTTSPLAARKVLDIMRKSVDTTRETIRSPCEALALFSHSCMLAVDFTLVGFSEDDRLEQYIESNDIKTLPSTWKDSTSYGFRYKHSQSSMHYLLKIHRLGGKCIITGLGLGDDKTATMEITTKDFFSESFFPFDMNEEGSGDKLLEQGFISQSRITDLANQFKVQIVQRLIPSLHKPGYEEDNTASSQSRGPQSQQQQQPIRDPSHPQPLHDFDPADPLRYPGRGGGPRMPRPLPGGEVPPGFEDEFELQRGPRGGMPGGRSPFDIGSHDLNPPGLGRNPPLVGPFFGDDRNMGMDPYGEFGGPGGGGMMPTGSHPMFGNRGQRGTDSRFPPGSRYDPVGPGGGGGMPGGPRNPFGGFNNDDFI